MIVFLAPLDNRPLPFIILTNDDRTTAPQDHAAHGDSAIVSLFSSMLSGLVKGIRIIGSLIGGNEGRLLGAFFPEISTRMRKTVRRELHDFSICLMQDAKRTGRDLSPFFAGYVLCYTGFFFILASAAAALRIILPLWISMLSVATATSVAVYIVFRKKLKEVQGRLQRSS